MFSVIIPYYKKRQFIERCIESVLNQTFKDFEIILVDDGSNDDICTFCIKNYDDAVKCIKQENQGVSAARNKGISIAKYEYIAFLDADDSWAESYLENIKNVILQEGNVKIIGSNYTRDSSNLDDANTPIKYKTIKDYFDKQVFDNTLFTSSSTVIHKSFFLNNHGFNSKLKRGEDLDMWFRTIASGGKVVYIENTVVFYSDEDTTQVTKSEGKLEDSILGNYLDIYNVLMDQNLTFRKSISKFVYLNLYPYFFSRKNHKESLLILKNIPYKVALLHLIYLIPFTIGEVLINSQKGRLRIRQYLKFTAQHLS